MTVNEFRSMFASLPLQASAFYEKVSKEYEDDPQDPEAKAKKKQYLNDYLENVTALHQQVNALFEKQEPVTQEEYFGMVEQFNKARKAINKFHRDFESFAANQSDLLNDLEAVALSVDPSAGQNMASAVQNTLTSVVQLKEDPDYLGDVSSRRFMMKIKKDDGTEVEGFFTKDARMFDFDPQGKVDDILQEALDKNPDDQMLENFVNKVRSSRYGTNGLLMCTLSKKEAERNKQDEEEKRSLYSELGRPYVAPPTYPGYDPFALKYQGFIQTSNTPSLEAIKRNKNIREVLKKIRNTYTEEEVDRMHRDWKQYGHTSSGSVQAKNGSTRSGRNSAMSTVASLLGVSNLIAKSTPMTAEFNGSIYRGTFMEKAEGSAFDWDKDKMMVTDFRKLKDDSFDGEVLKELATIQIIDFICQNVDRHQNNLIYVIGEDGKVKHVIGIDNDFSFGTRKLNPDEKIHHGIRLNDITVIPKHLQEAIEKLDANTLMGALSNSGLTNSELLAAGKRFYQLKEHVRNNPNTGDRYVTGKVKVIPEENWADKKLSEFSTRSLHDSEMHFTENSSLFRIVGNMLSATRQWIRETEGDPDYERKLKVDQMIRERKAAQLESNGVKVRKTFSATQNSDLVSANGLQQHQDKLNRYLENLKRTQHWYQKKHEEYTDMRDTLAVLAAEQPSVDMDQNKRLTFERRILALEKKVNRYIAYKAPKNDGWHGATRLKEAKELAAYLKSYRESFHDAYNEKLDAEMDVIYQEYVNDRKVDNIAHAVVCGVMKVAKDATVETVETSIRNDKAFINLLNSRADALDHFSELAETDPKAVFLAYVKELKDSLEKDVEKKEAEAVVEVKAEAKGEAKGDAPKADAVKNVKADEPKTDVVKNAKADEPKTEVKAEPERKREPVKVERKM